MKNIRTLTIFTTLLAFLTTVQGQVVSTAAEEQHPQGELGLYEKFSGYYFVLLSITFIDAETEEEKLGILHDYLYSSFEYWLQTRKGSLRSSKAIDNLMKRNYRGLFLEFKQSKDLSLDPLWRSKEQIRPRPPVEGFEDMTLETYQEFVKEFEEFLALEPEEEIEIIIVEQ